MSSQQTTEGDIEYDEYDIDPTELEVDIETEWYNNNVSNIMARIKGSDLWICYSSWKTVSGERSHSIERLGELTIEPVELDSELIVDQIQSVAEDVAEIDGDQEFADELKARAPDLAESMIEEWAFNVSEVIGEALGEENLAHCGTEAWVSHVGLMSEAKYAVRDVGIEDENGFVCDTLVRALYDAVEKHQHRDNPDAEYIARLSFEVEPWELRALELHQNGVFGGKMETARVQALRETGMRPSDIADVLDVNPSTVTRHKNRADEWRDRAEWTVENCASD